EDRRGARPLDRDERGLVRPIVERDASREVPLDVHAVLGDVRGVHDHQVLVVGEPVDDDVVDDRAPLVRQEAVPGLPDCEPRDVARDHAVDRRARARAGEEELAHVRQVEEPGVRPDRPMLRDDPGRVLDRHLVARELDHLAARPKVLGMERRALEFGHGCAASARSSTSRYVSKVSIRRASGIATQRTSSYSASWSEGSPPAATMRKKWTTLWTRSPPAAKLYVISPSARTMRTSRPVSSRTSRSAVCSSDSPSVGVPFGKTHEPSFTRPRSATSGPCSPSRTTTPPAAVALRGRSGGRARSRVVDM